MAIVKAENARKDIPLVSIIAVCYNHSKYVEETLDSGIFKDSNDFTKVLVNPSNKFGYSSFIDFR